MKNRSCSDSSCFASIRMFVAAHRNAIVTVDRFDESKIVFVRCHACISPRLVCL
jgi:hypothetical protein